MQYLHVLVLRTHGRKTGEAPTEGVSEDRCREEGHRADDHEFRGTTPPRDDPENQVEDGAEQKPAILDTVQGAATGISEEERLRDVIDDKRQRDCCNSQRQPTQCPRIWNSWCCKQARLVLSCA